jgi:teichoic acid transport system permease protein
MEPVSTTTFVDEVHVYEPHKASLPPMGTYLREFWRRRRFAYEMSRTTQKAANFETALGTVWVVLNPLMLALVYYLLISVVSFGTKGTSVQLLHIIVGIFTWYFAQNSMGLGAVSVTMGGKLILNQAFPRALLPFASVISAFIMYLPTIPVYLVIWLGFYLVNGSDAVPPFSAALALLPVYVLILAVISYGLAMIFATMTVYFRDTNRFLGYLLRIWLYLTPVLYLPSKLLAHHTKGEIVFYGNPLGTVIGSITSIWEGDVPPLNYLVVSVVWAVVTLLVGAYLFISRERDFAVRL